MALTTLWYSCQKVAKWRLRNGQMIAMEGRNDERRVRNWQRLNGQTAMKQWRFVCWAFLCTIIPITANVKPGMGV
jgi:hypothetical protein